MASLQKKFEAEMSNLRKLIAENTERREAILGLKEQLFKGTSIQESRKSVESTEVTIVQGHNTKLLTLVSIFFLVPLTFVTSIFGITNMPTERHYWAVGAVTAAVCVPFFVLIGSLNTTPGMHWWKRKTAYLLRLVGRFLKWIFSCGCPGTATAHDQDDPGVEVNVEHNQRRVPAKVAAGVSSRRPSVFPHLSEKAEPQIEDCEADVKSAVHHERSKLDRAPSSTLVKMWMKERKRAVSSHLSV